MTDTNIDRILRERLEQFNVPVEVRHALKAELLTYFQRPEKKPHGACVLTVEASMAADKARQEKKTQPPDSSKPLVI